MTCARRSRLVVVCLVATWIITLLPRTSSAEPAHLWWAETLINNIAPADNEYAGSPSYVTWSGVAGATRYSNRTHCNVFVNLMLQQAYGWTETDMIGWLGSRSPTAPVYYSAILAGNGFVSVQTLDEVQPGDIIAIRYPEESSANGHLAIVQGAPVFHPATPPVVTDTYQFEVTIADSTRTAHGWSDTRMNADGTTQMGAGFGVMRLYADAELNIVGHTWSLMGGTSYRDVSTYPLAIGRLN
jgi:hypothetical protein